MTVFSCSTTKLPITVIVLFLLCSWGNIATANQYDHACKQMENGNYIQAYSGFYGLAVNNDVDAQFNLGMLILSNFIGDMNKDKAVFWMKKAADGGHQAAQYSLSHMYTKGIGTEINNVEARKYLQLSVSQEYVPALYEMGMILLIGRGVKQDLENGLKLMERAADAGNPYALIQLAIFYKDGFLVEKNLEKYSALVEQAEMFDMDMISEEVANKRAMGQ